MAGPRKPAGLLLRAPATMDGDEVFGKYKGESAPLRLPSDLSWCLLLAAPEDAMLFAGLLLEGKCRTGDDEARGVRAVAVSAADAEGVLATSLEISESAL